MPEFAEAEPSPMGCRASVTSPDAGARVAKSGGSKAKVLLGLVAVAFTVKLALFGLAVGTSTGLSIPNAENWQDFMLAYAPAAHAVTSGFMPYRDFFYPYPPLFLWALAAFSPFPYTSWLPGFPLVAADALTVVPVYLIAREFSGERSSRMVSILFIFAPTNLYYSDYLLLNPPLTTLFLMTSIYLLLKRRYGWSALALALSIGMKQTALFALPVILLITWRRSGRRLEVLRYLGIVVATCFAFSLPYLLTAPILYIDSMLRLPLNTFGLPGLPPDYYGIGIGSGTQVTFDTTNWLTSRWALLWEGVYSPATLILPFFLLLAPPQLFSAYYSLYLTVLMTLILLTGLVLVLRGAWRKRHLEETDVLRYVLLAMLVVFTFYPFYKYYVVGIVPLLVLLVRSRKDLVGFLGFTFVLMLVPRFLGSWVLLVTLVWLLRSYVKQLEAGLTSRREASKGLPMAS